MNANELPAFPCPDRSDGWADSGMTLRDYFAAKVVAAFIAEPIGGMEESMAYELSDITCDAFAKSAYQMADAMLRARDA